MKIEYDNVNWIKNWPKNEQNTYWNYIESPNLKEKAIYYIKYTLYVYYFVVYIS